MTYLLIALEAFGLMWAMGLVAAAILFSHKRRRDQITFQVLAFIIIFLVLVVRELWQ